MTTATTGAAPAAPAATSQAPAMTHREVLEALSGILLGLFVAILSSTIVSIALPRIVTDLHGSQTQYTWVVTATLLASTATTPIWGKLADLMSKKLLVQIAIVVFITGSMAAGLSQNMETLIGFRVLQGIGLGGLQALAQIVMAAMIPPRERGRYNGLLGAVMAVGIMGGPLLGGVIVDTSWLGWRWCFYAGAPVAVVAFLVIQRTLKLPVLKRPGVKVDYLGAAFIAGAVSVLLIWSSFAGNQFAWASTTSYAYVIGGVLLLAVAIVIESRAAEPIVPLKLFKNRTMVLATVASAIVGLAMFGSTVFLGQYYQIARGFSPTKAGLMTFPLVLGLVGSSTISGALISKYGRWKAFIVAGSISLTAGMFLLSGLDHATPLWEMSIYLVLLGAGVGMSMQNLVLSVQNAVPLTELGTASSAIAFFRSLGGTIGVSALGSVLTHHVTTLIAERVAAAGIPTGGSAGGSVGLADLEDLPAPVRALIMGSYGDAVGRVFLVAGVAAVLVVLCVLFIKEVPLRQTLDLEAPKTGDAATGPADELAPAATPAVDTEAEYELPADPFAVDGPFGPTPVGTEPEVGFFGEPLTEEPAVKDGRHSWVRADEALGLLAEAEYTARTREGQAAKLHAGLTTEVTELLEMISATETKLAEHAAKLRDSLAQANQEVLPPEHPGRHATTEDLRAYELSLLGHSEEVARRLVDGARLESERMVGNAQTEVAELTRRVQELQELEQRLAGSVRAAAVDRLG